MAALDKLAPRLNTITKRHVWGQSAVPQDSNSQGRLKDSKPLVAHARCYKARRYQYHSVAVDTRCQPRSLTRLLILGMITMKRCDLAVDMECMCDPLMNVDHLIPGRLSSYHRYIRVIVLTSQVRPTSSGSGRGSLSNDMHVQNQLSGSRNAPARLYRTECWVIVPRVMDRSYVRQCSGRMAAKGVTTRKSIARPSALAGSEYDMLTQVYVLYSSSIDGIHANHCKSLAPKSADSPCSSIQVPSIGFPPSPRVR